jgi:long-chain acyl-CoA synthetase
MNETSMSSVAVDTKAPTAEPQSSTVSDAVSSVAQMFLKRVAETPERVAFRYPSGSDWKEMTWEEMGTRVRRVASGLHALGLVAEQRCGILSATRLEWIVVDLGVLCAGGATTTIYPSSTPDECVYILNDSESVVVFVDSVEQLQKLRAKREELATVKRVVVFDESAAQDDWVISLGALESMGRDYDEQNPGAFERSANAIPKTAMATMIYTSGTTGVPKGVELTHDNWVYESEAIDALGFLNQDDVQFLWLPLAHSFGKVLEVAQLRIGFATGIDGRVERIVDNLKVVRPTFVAAVPRIFEKVYAKILDGARQGGRLKHAIFNWAFDVGRAHSVLQRQGRRPGLWLSFKRAVADRLVFRKLRALFGDRLRFFVSGSAPLALELSEFFHAAGVLILEGYGLTESSAASFVNLPDRYKLGSVGVPLPGTLVKIADDGEILLGGRGIMRGYHGLEAATEEALEEGWLLTGDIGKIDEDGFLMITDRKKNLIKTSGGKYVAPQLLEGKLKAHCPYLSQVIVHGDRRKFCTALVTFDAEALRSWADSRGHAGGYADLVRHPEAREIIQTALDEVNATLPRYATIKKFAILPADLTQEAGHLTASLKVRRRVVEDAYKDVLDSMYANVTED